MAIFGAGFGVAGAQVGVNALAASYYSTESRATGVSWANAVGRTGSVLGSMVGGVLVSRGWDLATVFAAAALPAFLAAMAMLGQAWLARAAEAKATAPVAAAVAIAALRLAAAGLPAAPAANAGRARSAGSPVDARRQEPRRRISRTVRARSGHRPSCTAAAMAGVGASSHSAVNCRTSNQSATLVTGPPAARGAPVARAPGRACPDHPFSRRGDDAELRTRIRDIATERRRFGYRRVHVILQRDGVQVNHKKLRRLYAEEKLQVKRRGGRKRALGRRRPMTEPDAPNRRWSLDFVSDAFANWQILDGDSLARRVTAISRRAARTAEEGDW